MKISIIIPAYNEEKRIGHTLKEYFNYFKIKKKNKEIKNFELLIVINNTRDRTEEIVKKYSRKYKEVKYLNFKQGGKGFAIIEGFKEALKGDWDLIGFVDADCSTAPEAFFDLIENIGKYDGIIASRYVNGAKVNPKQSFKRIFVSRIFNFLVRALFLLPYSDTQCGAKLFKKKAISKVINELIITQWAFDVDLLYKIKLDKLGILECPTVWSDKEYSKINLSSAGLKMFLAVVRLRVLNSPLKNIIRVYNKIAVLMRKLK